MDDNTPTPAWIAEKAKLAAELFVVGIGMLYASGFLTTFTFLERFDLREMGADAFRLKYIYVGILYFLFPVTIAVPLLALLVLKRRAIKAREEQAIAARIAPPAEDADKHSTPLLRIPFPSIMAVFNMLLMFYVVTLFSPLGAVRQSRSWVLFALMCATLAGALGLRALEDHSLSKFSVRKKPQTLHRLCKKSRRCRRLLLWVLLLGLAEWNWFRRRSSSLRWLLLLLLLWLDRKLTHGLWADLNRMFFPPNGGLYYYGLIILALFVAQRLYTRVRQYRLSAIRGPFIVLGTGVLASLFFFSVLSFASRVYPYIPVGKGGGDYQKAGLIILHFTRDSKPQLPEEIIDVSEEEIVSVPLILIEETSSVLYAAIPGQAADWRNFKNLPDIYAIQMLHITSVTHVKDYMKRNWVKSDEGSHSKHLSQAVHKNDANG